MKSIETKVEKDRKYREKGNLGRGNAEEKAEGEKEKENYI